MSEKNQICYNSLLLAPQSLDLQGLINCEAGKNSQVGLRDEYEYRYRAILYWMIFLLLSTFLLLLGKNTASAKKYNVNQNKFIKT